LAAALPRKADRIDMRYQWLGRFLSNPHIHPEKIMKPYAEEILEKLTSQGKVLIFMLWTREKWAHSFQGFFPLPPLWSLWVN
jgi:hypothetical protein